MNFSEWQILFMSALPITELRISIPVALAMGMAPLKAYILAVIGNILPLYPIMLLLKPVKAWLRLFPGLNTAFEHFLLKTKAKGEHVQKYGLGGLLIFVAIPLPGTGAWTGALLAWLLGLNINTAFLAISCGVMVAGTIVTLASIGVIKMAFFYDLEYLLIFLLILLFFLAWRKSKKRT